MLIGRKVDLFIVSKVIWIFMNYFDIELVDYVIVYYVGYDVMVELVICVFLELFICKV